MRTLLTILLMLPVLCNTAYAYNFTGVTLKRVYDGDTFFVDIASAGEFFGKNVAVRIKGIDCPELKSKNSCEHVAALKAQVFLEETLKNKKSIDLIGVEKDKYFRLLADVKADGIDVGGALLKKKLAVPYDGGTKQKIDWCKYVVDMERKRGP